MPPPASLTANTANASFGASTGPQGSTGSTAVSLPPPIPATLTAKAYGRGIKRTADGVIYTDTNKIIAVHYAFYKPDGKKRRTVEEAEKSLKVARKTLYQWKKQFPLAAGESQTLPAGAVLTKTIETIRSRADADNLSLFRTPGYAAPTTTSIRPDGLGPGAELVSSTTAIHPGFVSPELVEQLRKIDEKIGLTEAEKDTLAVRVDDDVSKAAEPFVSESVRLAVQSKLTSLEPGTVALWTPPQQRFLVFWKILNRIGSNDTTITDEEPLVTEQKLVTFLNCYVLRKNPWLGHEGVDTNIKAITNLWQCQKLAGKNHHPSPREGLLVRAYLDAIAKGRVALRELKYDDDYALTLRNGYGEDEYHSVSKWFLAQAVKQRSNAHRARLEFLWQHAIMGRAGDMRNAKLRHFYTSELPQSEPQKCIAVVQSIFEGKTNKDGRPERGVVARAKDVVQCPVSALAFYLFERYHVRGESPPDFSSRSEWYDDRLLIDPSIPATKTTGLTAEKQCALLRQAFADVGIISSNFTHAMRHGGARFAAAAGCSDHAIKQHGRWATDVCTERYMTDASLPPVRALAGFHRDGGDYWLPRTLLEPPDNLSSIIFPWADTWRPSLAGRAPAHEDKTAGLFLDLIVHLRTVLLQDAVFLQQLYPTLSLWSSAPFCSAEFSSWSILLRNKTASTPDPFELSLHTLTPTISNALASMRVDISALGSEVRRDAQDTRAVLEEMMGKLDQLMSRRSGSDVELAELENSCTTVLSRIQALRGTEAQPASSTFPPRRLPALLPSAPLPTPPMLTPAVATSSTVAAPDVLQAAPRSLSWPETVEALWVEWAEGVDGKEPLKVLADRQDDICTKGNSARTMMKRIRKIIQGLIEVSGGDHSKARRAARILDTMRKRGEHKKDIGLRSLAEILTTPTTRAAWITAAKSQMDPRSA
ncbi:hypothetical protein CF319_g329 [Tilletia indica]|nr:hypothetical protein CF319_g329 [Tilletia indica]